jgi:4-hydroxybenzoyl-CoA reductase subunit beta
MRIGAMCRLGDIEQHPLVRHLLPSLTTAISSIASPQIRNRATIGGNLCLNTRCFYFDQSEFWRGSLGYCLKHGSGICHAAPGLKHCSAVLSSDLAPLLMALDASITIAGSTGLRTVPLSQLYTDDGMSPNSLGRGELLAEIIIPPQVANARTAFKKLRRRRSIDYPLVNVGTTAVVGADNVVRTIRIIVGAVQSMPVELHASETILLGHRLTLDQIDRAAEAAAGHVKPLPNAIEPVLYRKVMVKRIVKEALLDLVA